MNRAFLVPLLLLSACKPPAADDYVERARIDRSSEGPSDPIDSPDTSRAIWAAASEGERLLYGNPGERPFFAIECVTERAEPVIAYTRFARADPHAKAVLALIGNSHVARFKIDAARIGDIWRWDGEAPALDPRWDVLTGTREVEATVPGAGSVILNPSPLPGTLVEDCRAIAAPPSSEEAEDAEPIEPSPPEDPA
ncbi:hypothetical protein [Qipengyuania flava]|uniref:hypothetical protein n=1 Tax=Qipengyuania flava TaxID=192812 RepID=UPI001C6372D7|nr:hypothetical protein [Qipengyuania flava]QYJ06676.1 hypothetical protein KUV82_11480 [Qipengyuania flava]